jgi:hypothetical protein
MAADLTRDQAIIAAHNLKAQITKEIATLADFDPAMAYGCLEYCHSVVDRMVDIYLDEVEEEADKMAILANEVLKTRKVDH